MSDQVRDFWRSLDEMFSDVRETPWGAVVTDGRFPAIWDANYARIDRPTPELSVEEVERELLPALRQIGCDTLHVVSFDPDSTTRLLAELSRRGHRLSWDVVMEIRRPPERPEGNARVVEISPDERLWELVQESLDLFGVSSPGAVAQMRSIERDVLSPGGKRWFGVSGPDGKIATLAALLVLGDVGYIDNVATFPEMRGRGFASAITSHLAREAFATGASTACLFADPDDAAVVRLYRRLGFEEAGRLAATRGPVPD